MTAKPLRILTAVAHYDGHDASVLALNRALLHHPAEVEVIYLGFNMAAEKICTAAVQEDADGVAVASYNGGHMHFFPHLATELAAKSDKTILLFGGGGGTISPAETEQLAKQGVARIYGAGISLDDVSKDMIERLSQARSTPAYSADSALPQLLSMTEMMQQDAQLAKRYQAIYQAVLTSDTTNQGNVLVITGDGGSGKSTIIDELTARLLDHFPEKRIAIIASDPTTVSQQSQSALLADRVRMNAIYHPAVYMRSVSTGSPYQPLNPALAPMLALCRAAHFDLIIIETPGVGQTGIDLQSLAPDLTVCVKTREYGSSLQLTKDQMLQNADLVVLNKVDLAGSEAAFQDLATLLHQLGKTQPPIGVQAKIHRDRGMDRLFAALCSRFGWDAPDLAHTDIFAYAKKTEIVPFNRRNYLAEVVATIKNYDDWVQEQLALLRQDPAKTERLDPSCQSLLAKWPDQWQKVAAAASRDLQMDETAASVGGYSLPHVALPDPADTVESLRFLLEEGLPGSFPFATGTYPYRLPTAGETTRQFAGLRGPRETNKRLHLLNRGIANPRLSIAFDGITLYGEDSDDDPGCRGKIGEGGVSVDTYEDMKLILKGFDIRTISTSLTINGPAPVILAMYFRAAMEIETEREEAARGRPLTPAEKKRLEQETCRCLRGTVQADILKEVQAQNECIFQTDFAMKMLGDIQRHFVDKGITSFYSLSISGYHIGEAGATPGQELAFTLANGFTYVEYFKKLGLAVDDFGANLSFFFRVSHEVEWLAYGPVCRKIWAVAMRDYYRTNSRCQRFKFHTQTSGRALQSREWDTLNPIRQAYHAYLGLLNNTNSLHVDSADEPMTTPSEKYVRQAAMIPNYLREEAEGFLVQNLLSGSYAFRAIAKKLQQAILDELERIDQLGGVGPAMELGYQRNCIAESSANYEWSKYPAAKTTLPKRRIIGFNTYVLPVENEEELPTTAQLIRPTEEDWREQIDRLEDFRRRHADSAEPHLQRLEEVVQSGGNIFTELLETVQHATLGQITRRLRKAGGGFRKMV